MKNIHDNLGEDMFSKLKSYYKTQRPTGPIEYIVVGLGNPGKEYENTRHNAGFMALDYICEKENISLKKLQFNALCNDGMIGGKRAFIMKPQTYMNKSGESVILAMQYYKIPIENVVVLCDDITLDVGKLRIRRKGSDGGQKGLKNIIRLGGDTFPRVRLGIDPKPHPQMDLADWVLSKFTPADMAKLNELYPNVHDAVRLILSGDIDKAMNLYN